MYALFLTPTGRSPSTTQYKPDHLVGLGPTRDPSGSRVGNSFVGLSKFPLGRRCPSIDVNYDTEGVNDRKAEKTRTTLFLRKRTWRGRFRNSPRHNGDGRGLRVSKGKSFARHSEESLARHSFFTKKCFAIQFCEPAGRDRKGDATK